VTEEPSFDIPGRPERRYTRTTVEYDGEVVFELSPPEGCETTAVEAVLADGPYRVGEFHDLPMRLFLVRDERLGDTFRVAVRDDRVELRVLPATEGSGLRAIYDRLVEHTGADWPVERRVDL
jgi:hypothetical protein